MAAPNLLTVTSIIGKSTYYTPAVTTANIVLLANAAASGQLIKVNQILCTSLSAAASVNVTVAYWTNGSVAQGSQAIGGTAYPIVYTLPLPIYSTLNAIEKSTALYLEENMSIVVTSGTANMINYSISYELIT